MKNGKLAAVAFGANEFGFGLFFSSAVWLQMQDGVYITTIINITFFICALLITIWQIFNRKKASSYLKAFAVRMIYLSSVFLICQISVYFENENNFKYLWLIIATLIYLFGIILHFSLEKKHWQLTLNEWQKADKMNVQKRYFRIYEAFHSHTQNSENFSKIYLVVPVGTIILTIVMGIIGNDFKTAFLHFAMMALGYFCIFMVGRILVWIMEVKQLEKELGVTFVTEYGMNETKPKRRNSKK